ncbi:hypothetical protein [Streptomyces sp. WAC 06725]|uniref:WXG100-like domain-containing protein n=1 Tax=Streptomyces sp. WAC 06725 TaxID=2203209 RepID=UPI0021ADA1EA|nr:hypothetical protein [Streptomyces sp. WAC 06725]
MDEDDYREMAAAMREFSSDIQDGASHAHDSIEALVSSAGGGKAAEALNAHWSKVNGTHLTKLAHCGELAATALDGVALLIEGAKISAIVQLGILAAEVIAAQAAAPLTLGLSELGALGATQATRMIVKRLFKEVCQQVTEHVVSIALTPVEEALAAMVGDLVIQLGANALGMQKGIDAGHAVDAGKEGFKQGVQGAKEAAGGMQLLSAGGSSGGGGGGGAGSGFAFDPDAHDKAVSGLQSAGGTFRHKAGGKISKAKGHHARTKGKDAIADAANGMLHKVIEGLEDGLKKTAKHLDDDMSRGVKQMKKNHQSNDNDTALSIAQIRKHGDKTPTYLLGDDGSVTRLRPDGTKDKLSEEDKKRIGLKFDGDNAGRPQSGEPLVKLDPDKPKPRPRQPSTRVDPGSTELSRATQLARHADSSYGPKPGKPGTPNNYAAARMDGTNGHGTSSW